MEIMKSDKIWLYLRNNERVLKDSTYAENSGDYLKGLLEILYLADSNDLAEIKLKMLIENKTEKLLYGDLFFRDREGYSQTEYRLVKLFKGSKSGRNLEKFFPELLTPIKEKPNYIANIIDLVKIEDDINYRSSIYIRYYQFEQKIVEDVDSLINQGCKIVADLIWYGPELPEKKVEPKEKVRRAA